MPRKMMQGRYVTVVVRVVVVGITLHEVEVSVMVVPPVVEVTVVYVVFVTVTGAL